MAGTLYVVSTPIGNLEDITLRALRVLREVRLVAAEDTRRTAQLLRHYDIRTPTMSLHEHNERARVPLLIRRLEAGDDIALVSDAGTPAIADPGSRLIRAARERGLPVVPVPGPSAVLAALVASGHAGEPFVFAGFPPARAKDRTVWLRNLAGERRTVVLFEAPHRIRQTLELMRNELGDRPIALARELTKLHEEVLAGPISELLGRLPDRPIGEFTLILPGNEQLSPPHRSCEFVERPSDELIARAYSQVSSRDGGSPRARASVVARRYGLTVNQVYAALERAKRLRQ
ncbi:MAG TPA: 16S rRNA (cytidine(1402)-2'-O)-methyltransferase [Vicinamibacterales bacterium]|nr:16S rRNA (cytidine(1402)-2'-O)-methyltransferase [Vicinamibacterales bacterium]